VKLLCFVGCRSDMKDQFGRTRKVAVIDVVPETGKTARMVKHNVFAGQVSRLGFRGQDLVLQAMKQGF
jgi:hypothetical protein